MNTELRLLDRVHLALANASGHLTEQQRKAMFAKFGRQGGGAPRTFPGRPSGSTPLPPNSQTTPIGEILPNPETPRGWGESRPGETYVQWEGPGNPSWERRHPELNPESRAAQPPELHNPTPPPNGATRRWGEERAGEYYLTWEGPGNPRWEREHPDMAPAPNTATSLQPGATTPPPAYNPAPGYGTPPEQRGGIRTTDWRDRDHDGIDDRDQDGPGQPRYPRPSTGSTPAAPNTTPQPLPATPSPSIPAPEPDPQPIPPPAKPAPRDNNAPPFDTGAPPILPTPGRTFFQSLSGLPPDRKRGYTPGIVPTLPQPVPMGSQVPNPYGIPWKQNPNPTPTTKPPRGSGFQRPIDRLLNPPATITYDPSGKPNGRPTLPTYTDPRHLNMIDKINAQLARINQRGS